MAWILQNIRVTFSPTFENTTTYASNHFMSLIMMSVWYITGHARITYIHRRTNTTFPPIAIRSIRQGFADLTWQRPGLRLEWFYSSNRKQQKSRSTTLTIKWVKRSDTLRTLYSLSLFSHHSKSFDSTTSQRIEVHEKTEISWRHNRTWQYSSPHSRQHLFDLSPPCLCLSVGVRVNMPR